MALKNDSIPTSSVAALAARTEEFVAVLPQSIADCKPRLPIRDMENLAFELYWLQKWSAGMSDSKSLSMELACSNWGQLANLSYVLGLPEAEWKFWYGVTARACAWMGRNPEARAYAVLSDQLGFATSLPLTTFDKNKRPEVHGLQWLLTGVSDAPQYDPAHRAAVAQLPLPPLNWGWDMRIVQLVLDILDKRFSAVRESLEDFADEYCDDRGIFGSVARHPFFEPDFCAICSMAIRAGLPAEGLSPKAQAFYQIALCPGMDADAVMDGLLGG